VLEDVSLEEVRRIFGDEFAEALEDLPAGSWQGPVRSAFGQHLVFVSRHEPGRQPELAEVRETIRRDWLAEQQRAAREAFYDNLRERYEVTIEGRQALASDAETPNRGPS
jgi:parvulin-like peptidyl-prolyl isomerase